jgi:hypothetical protein
MGKRGDLKASKRFDASGYRQQGKRDKTMDSGHGWNREK